MLYSLENAVIFSVLPTKRPKDELKVPFFQVNSIFEISEGSH